MVLRPVFIAIAGPTGSGKSVLAQALDTALQQQSGSLQPLILHEDAYYRDQGHLDLTERELTNYDHPAALEHALLELHLACLKRGESIAVPRYDFKAHTRSGFIDSQSASRLVIVEGALLLSNPALVSSFDLRIFLDTPLDTCLERRIGRDIRERGRDKASVLRQFEQYVIPMYSLYCLPGRSLADIVIPDTTPERALERVMPAVRELLESRHGRHAN